jgi:hypothetical protein
MLLQKGELRILFEQLWFREPVAAMQSLEVPNLHWAVFSSRPN